MRSSCKPNEGGGVSFFSLPDHGRVWDHDVAAHFSVSKLRPIARSTKKNATDSVFLRSLCLPQLK